MPGEKNWPVIHPPELQSGLFQSELEPLLEGGDPVDQSQYKPIERVAREGRGDYFVFTIRRVRKQPVDSS